MSTKRKSYPTDVSDEEWAFCVDDLTGMTEEAPAPSPEMPQFIRDKSWFRIGPLEFLKKPIAHPPTFAYIPGSVPPKETDSITCGTDN